MNEYGPRDKPMTAKQLAHWWAVEAAKQKERADVAEAALQRANDKIKQLEQRLGIYST